MERLEKYYRIFLPIVGLLCIFIPHYIAHWLPTVLGVFMVLTSLTDLFFEIKEKRFLNAYQTRASSLILFIMGICFILGQESTIPLMGITWGLLGLQEANEEIENILLKRSQNQKYFLASIIVFIKIILSVALLFDPLEKFNFHIFLLGLEILVINIKEKNITHYVISFKKKLKNNHFIS